MDQVYNVHHTILRRLIAQHGGYENLTEGDSFIMTFHNPKSACNFCVHAQVRPLSPLPSSFSPSHIQASHKFQAEP